MDSSGDDPTTAAVAWLLSSDEPAVRHLTRRDVLDDRDGAAAAADAAQLLEGPKARALLAGQQPDGGYGVHPYSKWTGAHWRLVSLVELAAPAGEPRLQAAASTVLDWLTSRSHRRRVQVIDGLTRRCASQEGNALAVACRLGRADDPRAELLAHSLVAWQWPDGGWNCDPRASGRRSSFHESLPPAWGLHEYWLATGATWAKEAAAQAAELFLSHRLFRSLSDGEVIDRRWLALHYPPYWHYDVLQALLILSRLGKAGDPRAGDALELLVRQREDLGTGMAGTGPVAKVDQFLRGPLQAEPLGQRRRQQQPGACDRVIVVERDIDMVKNDVRGSHRKGVLRLLVNDSLAAVILPGQRTLFIIRPGSPDHSIGGSRLSQVNGRVAGSCGNTSAPGTSLLRCRCCL